MVAAGLIISATEDTAFGRQTRAHTEGFWEAVEQGFNILLFTFIGLNVLFTETTRRQMIALALAAR